MIIAVLISSILAIILIPKFGALGAGIAIFLGNFVGPSIISNVIYHKKIDFDIIKFLRAVYTKGIIPLTFAIFTGWLLNIFISSVTIQNLLLKIVLFTIIYIVLMYLLYATKKEKLLITKVLKFRWRNVDE